MKNYYVAVGGCLIGCLLGIMFLPSSENDNNSSKKLSNTSKTSNYKVVEKEDYSLGTRKRISIKVVFEERDIDSETVRASLLRLASSLGADAVLAYGYWPGDDWQDIPSAGKLEWGKSGVGWVSNSSITPEGNFEPAKSLTIQQNTDPDKLATDIRGAAEDFRTSMAELAAQLEKVQSTPIPPQFSPDFRERYNQKIASLLRNLRIYMSMNYNSPEARKKSLEIDEERKDFKRFVHEETERAQKALLDNQ